MTNRYDGTIEFRCDSHILIHEIFVSHYFEPDLNQYIGNKIGYLHFRLETEQLTPKTNGMDMQISNSGQLTGI